jgi:plastocyanin
MKRAIALALATAAAIAAFALPSGAASRSVSVGDNFFKPASITVSKGSLITFRWTGSGLHNVTRTSGPSFTKCGDRTSGRCPRRMSRRGTLRLICTIHGFRMKVVIR